MITLRLYFIFIIVVYHNIITSMTTVTSFSTPINMGKGTSSGAKMAMTMTTQSFYRHMTFHVKKLSESATIPTRGSEYAAGLDLSSAKKLCIQPGERTLVPTDLAIACPPGTYGRIAPRSGLAYKFGIDVGAGVIDADYRGPLGVILFNFGTAPFEINIGDRIAQLILEQIVLPDVIECDDDTILPTIGERGSAGFGSTGVQVTKDNTTSPSARESSDDDDEIEKQKRQRTVSPQQL